MIFCGLPFSWTWKSLAVRPRTTSPVFSVADDDVGEHQVAVDLEGVGGLRIRCRGLILRSDRHRSQEAHEGEGGESAKVADDVHPN